MSEDGFRDPPEIAHTPEVPRADEPVPAEIPNDGSARYKLLVPVMVPAKGGPKEVAEIVCRRPTGADMLAVGNPVKFNPTNGDLEHDVSKMPMMIWRLSGHVPAVLDKMDTRDLTGLFWSITHFFLPPVGRI